MLAIGTKILKLATGQRGFIAGNKSIPHKPTVNVYNKKEMFPSNDYLIFLVKEIKDSEIDFSGPFDVHETEIQEYEW